jgi:hypothetical protein
LAEAVVLEAALVVFLNTVVDSVVLAAMGASEVEDSMEASNHSLEAVLEAMAETAALEEEDLVEADLAAVAMAEISVHWAKWQMEVSKF